MFFLHARKRRQAEPSAAGRRAGLLRGRRGSVLLWVAFLMPPLLGFVGLGVDSARAYLVHGRLAVSLDSAAIAAGRNSADQTAAEEGARMIFKANFPPDYMDATLTGPTFEFNSTADTVKISASAVMPTYFIHLLGVETLTVSASSEVTRRTIYMDVVVSIDVSGSMNDYIAGTRKIDAARSAAHTLVDVLFGVSETKALLKMAFVTWNADARILPIGATYNSAETISQSVTAFQDPYSTSTSVTTLWYAKDSPVPLLSLPAPGWTGCVHARYLHDSIENDSDLRIDFPTVSTKVWKAFKPALKNYNNATMQCTNQGIQRLTNTKATITAAINSATSPSGNTNLIAGLIWGRSLLGRDGPFAGDETPIPAPGMGELVRAIVFMTDGANTQSATDAYEGKLTATKMNDRTKLAAQAAKDSGIVIYAIQFGFNDSTQSALMKLVASGPTAPYYQYAPDAASLKTAFEEIGNHLSKLRLSK